MNRAGERVAIGKEGRDRTEQSVERRSSGDAKGKVGRQADGGEEWAG